MTGINEGLICNWCERGQHEAMMIVRDDRSGLATCTECIIILLDMLDADAVFNEQQSQLISDLAKHKGIEFEDVILDAIRWRLSKYDFAQVRAERPEPTPVEDPLSCSFCNKPQFMAQRLLAHRDKALYVCDECAEQFRDVVGDPMFSPQEIGLLRQVCIIENKLFGKVIHDSTVIYLGGSSS